MAVTLISSCILKDRDWAVANWPRVHGGLDCTATFGPDFNPEKPPGEWWCEIVFQGWSVGMGWARRFTPGASIMNYGQANFADTRGYKKNLGLSADDLRMLRRQRLSSTVDTIFESFPQCRTIISLVYSTNTKVIEIMDGYGRTKLGIIPDGDRQLHMYLVKERSQ